MLSKLQFAERGAVFALLAAIGFSTKAIFIKLAYASATVAPITLMLLRLLFSLPFFLYFGFAQRGASMLASSATSPQKFTKKEIFALIIVGALGYYGASIFDFLGLQYISAALERLILFTYPTLTLILSFIFFQQKLSKRQVLAMMIAYLGIMLAFVHDLSFTGDKSSVMLGIILVLASSLSFALYLVFSGKFIERMGASRFTAWAMLIATVLNFIHFCLTQPLSSLILPWQIYAYGIALASFSTLLPVYAQTIAIRDIGASKTAIISMLGPPLTIFFGMIFLGEAFSWWYFCGAVLVIYGTWLSRK